MDQVLTGSKSTNLALLSVHRFPSLPRVSGQYWGDQLTSKGLRVSDLSTFTFKIPSTIPAGDYLLRIEQIGLHVAGAPQFYISCAQLKVTGGGSANPSKVSIPGYVSATDPGLTGS